MNPFYALLAANLAVIFAAGAAASRGHLTLTLRRAPRR